MKLRNIRRKWKAPEKVLEFLKGERQWRRSERIANAQYELRSATDNAQKRFWEDVLRALGAKVPGRVQQRPRKPQRTQKHIPQTPAAAIPLAA